MKLLFRALFFIVSMYIGSAKADNYAIEKIKKTQDSHWKEIERKATAALLEDKLAAYGNIYRAHAILSACNKGGLAAALSDYNYLLTSPNLDILNKEMAGAGLDKDQETGMMLSVLSDFNFNLAGFQSGLYMAYIHVFEALDASNTSEATKAFCSNGVNLAEEFIKGNYTERKKLDEALKTVGNIPDSPSEKNAEIAKERAK